MQEIIKKLHANPYLGKNDIEPFIGLVEKWIAKVDIGSMSESEHYVTSNILRWLKNNSREKIATKVMLMNKNNSWYKLSVMIV